MERKFSTVITEQDGAYTVVLNCWVINAEGVRETIASEQKRVSTYPDARDAEGAFYDQHKED